MSRRAYALGALDITDVVQLAYTALVDAQLLLRRGCDWVRLSERDRCRLARPLGHVARGLGELELLGEELAAEAAEVEVAA
jgi:hypothetical protein